MRSAAVNTMQKQSWTAYTRGPVWMLRWVGANFFFSAKDGSRLAAYTASHPSSSRTPLIRINWDGKPTGYAGNPDNWIFI